MVTLTWSKDSADYGFYRYSVTFTGTTDFVMLQSNMGSVSAAVHPASGTARVEFTLSSPADVQAGIAKWVVWPMGDVSKSSADGMISCATAIRAVASASNAVFEVCAK